MLDKYVQIVFPYFFQCPTYRALPFWTDQFKAAIRSEEHYHHRDILEYLLEILLLLPQSILSALLFADIADKAGKYAVPVTDHFSERHFHRKLLAILAQGGNLDTLPVEMPLASRQISPESGYVQLPHEFRHEHGQGFPDQIDRVVTKDSRRGGVSKQDSAAFIHADHSIAGCLDNDAMPFFAALELLLGPLPIFDIGSRAVPLNDAACFVAQRHVPKKHQTVFSISSPKSGFSFEGSAGRQRRAPFAHGVLNVFWVKYIGPSPSLNIFQRDTHIFQPALVEEIDIAVGTSAV